MRGCEKMIKVQYPNRNSQKLKSNHKNIIWMPTVLNYFNNNKRVVIISSVQFTI